MIDADVIIIGGGPAGSSCAWMLRRLGVQAVILEKEFFPKAKPCAGWITPSVLRILDILPDDYPFGMLTMKRIAIHILGNRVMLPTRQFSIRRHEFDSWLLQRTGALVYAHRAYSIRREDGYYIIDDTFRSRYLVGAGGTECPVYTAFFRQKRPRADQALILAMENEIRHQWKDDTGHIWFFEKGLSGYSWCVPKDGGYLNVGVGGKHFRLKQGNASIRDHWNLFVNKLKGLSVDMGGDTLPRGYAYYIRRDTGPVQHDNAYLTGDAAALATIDLGEGIGPAVRSGVLAAKSIVAGKPYCLDSISRFSLGDIIFPGRPPCRHGDQ